MAIKYEPPEEYYFRLHHIRPRFKADVENVLIYLAEEISKLPRMKKENFIVELNNAIRRYPGNLHRVDKTINNWRTEISSLFGLIEFDSDNDECYPGAISNLLSENQDLVEFFKYFLYYFQYPGGHLKPHETKKLIEKQIKFHPARYILNLLKEGEKYTGRRFAINKAEATHCVFNDLRVTRDGISPTKVVELIHENRIKNVNYCWEGDVIRYAGDILDYMLIANLLVLHGNKYFINPSEKEAIDAFIETDSFFEGYDYLYSKEEISLNDIKVVQDDWFHYVNHKLQSDIFTTDIFDYLGINEEEYKSLSESVLSNFCGKIGSIQIGTKEIGDFGESLVHGHECMRLKKGGREDLMHLVKRIPTSFSVGYDVQSVELNRIKRYIEVKTTVSMKEIMFNRIHLTTNEWDTAQSLKGRYFIYRLMINKKGTKLFVLQDPVEKFKDGTLSMTPKNGADITFEKSAGEMEDILLWEN